MNPRLLLLAVGTFAIGSGSFIFAGVLDDVAAGLSVSVGTAGLLITVYGVAYGIGSPLLATLTGALDRRSVLLLSLAAFALGNALAALAPSMPAMVGARLLTALAAGVFTPAAAAAAAGLVAPQRRGQALSVVLGGLSVAFVLGVPLGSLIAGALGWRATFAFVAALAAIGTAGLALLLPPLAATAPIPLRRRLDVLRRGPVVGVLAVSLLTVTSGFVVFAYFSPLLERLTDLGSAGITGLLVVFGLATVGGNLLGGYSADHWPWARSMRAMLVAQALALAAFSVLDVVDSRAAVIAGTVAALLAWGVVGFSFVPPQQSRLMDLAPDADAIVLSLNASAMYLGQSVGATVGGLVLSATSLGALGVTGTALTAGTLVVLAVVARRSERQPVAPAARWACVAPSATSSMRVR